MTGGLDRLSVYHRADTPIYSNLQAICEETRAARGNTQTLHREASAVPQVQT